MQDITCHVIRDLKNNRGALEIDIYEIQENIDSKVNTKDITGTVEHLSSLNPTSEPAFPILSSFFSSMLFFTSTPSSFPYVSKFSSSLISLQTSPPSSHGTWIFLLYYSESSIYRLSLLSYPNNSWISFFPLSLTPCPIWPPPPPLKKFFYIFSSFLFLSTLTNCHFYILIFLSNLRGNCFSRFLSSPSS